MTDTEPKWRGRLTLPDGEEWAVLARLLEGLLGRVYKVDISVRRGRAVIEGKVYSEQVRIAIQRLVALHAPVEGIENELTWASPLYSADQGDVDEEFAWHTDSAPRADAVRVDRYPGVKPLAQAVPGRRLDLMVDLTVGPDSYSAGSFTLQTETGWTELDIDVTIVCDGLDVPAALRRKVVTLNSDGSSIPALFSGTVTANDKLVLSFHFAHRGNDCGYAEREIAIQQQTVDQAVPAPLAPANYAAIHSNREAPHLTIRINSREPRGECHWSFEVRPELRDRVSADAFGFNEFGEGTQAYFNRQFSECPTLEPGRHQNRLRGIGETIWRATPTEFRDLYIAIRNISGPGFPIQLITNEPYVPWEMMFPDDERVTDPSHLFCEHSIARWFVRSGPRVMEFESGRRMSFVPSYSGANALPATMVELAWMVKELGAETGTATYAGFGDLLRKPQNPRVQLVHYAGHGAAAGEGDHGLWLGDGWVTEDEINGSVILGRDHHPFFALNACQVGRTSTALGSVAGWPMALTSRGFGGVMAPLWSVEDGSASLFAQSFLRAFLIERKNLGDSARIARAEHSSTSSDAYAYLLYGDVMALASG